MEEQLKIDCDMDLSQLFLDDEIKFRTKDPQIKICRRSGSITFNIVSSTQKNIDRAIKSLRNIPLIFHKVISIP
ncbi:MAG: hypothetical protein ABIJ21_03705 [Nanoarchaeota archaeon]